MMIYATSDLEIVYDPASSKLEMPLVFLKTFPYLLGGFLATLISAMQQSGIIENRAAFQRLVNSLVKWLDENFGDSEDEYFDEGSELEVFLNGMGDENNAVFDAVETALNSLPDKEGWPRTEEEWRE